MQKFLTSLMAVTLVATFASGLCLSAQAGYTPSATVVRNERLLPEKKTTDTPKDTGDTKTPEKTTPSTKTPVADTQKPTTETTKPTTSAKPSSNDEKIAAVRKKVSGANFLSKVEKDTLRAHNELRESMGLQTLTFDADLQTAARLRSYELYKADMFAHTRPDGREWYTVLKEDVPYTFVKAGENLCTTEYTVGGPNPAYEGDFWTQSWIDSPSHYETMTDPAYDRVGIGIYCVKKNGVTQAYATALFSRTKK